jgi:hypothetical protein
LLEISFSLSSTYGILKYKGKSSWLRTKEKNQHKRSRRENPMDVVFSRNKKEKERKEECHC